LMPKCCQRKIEVNYASTSVANLIIKNYGSKSFTKPD